MDNEKTLYHYYRKDSSYVRDALFKAYGGKCFYCGISLEPRHMHVDHILPTNKSVINDEEVKRYIKELEDAGFIQDSIENYVPSCASCNIKKSNQIFNASNLRFFHEQARKHVDKILSGIEQARKDNEYFYEPVSPSIWEELTFSYQRDISHAIMGYRLSSEDVNSCPVFPQVHKTEKLLTVVDHVIIQGETGCGKSISMFQVAHRFFTKGWKVYLLKQGFNNNTLILPDNTENSLYLVDDAQIFADSLIDQITRQARSNRKVLFARTISDAINFDSVLLTKKDAVDVLYKDFLARKNEIWPIVKHYDNTIGVGFSDTPIEHRLEYARQAETPWQFSYILRGGWKSMREFYKSICDYNDRDLLVATIAVFQILQLDKAVDYSALCKKVQSINPQYKWNDTDLGLLINRKIVLSKDDIRIVHLESANVIAALFFDQKRNEKQDILLKMIEESFIDREISPLGIVWLCNGSGRHSMDSRHLESVLLTERIVENVPIQLYDISTSEEIRNLLFLLDKIIISNKKEKGIKVLLDNKERIAELINNADSVSALGFSELFNSMHNFDHKRYCDLSRRISWSSLMKRMMKEQTPNYYAWGKLFDRGLSLLGKRRYGSYSDEMYEVSNYKQSSTN